MVRNAADGDTIRLESKVAIITGAVGAIGTEASKLFAAHGAQVILADVSDEAGKTLASEIGSSAHYKHCDVSKEADVASVVDFAVEKFGKLDIMFNNAGIITPVENWDSFDMDDYDRSHAIMVRGVLAGIKHAARVMIPVKQGVILNTGSIASTVVSENFPLAYSICKTNIPGITSIAAYHLGKHGIRVNAISPLGMPSPIVVDWLLKTGVANVTFPVVKQAFIDISTLLGKTATEQDIAMGALFLCSDESRYVSGQNLVVDGGWSAGKAFNAFPKAFNAFP